MISLYYYILLFFNLFFEQSRMNFILESVSAMVIGWPAGRRGRRRADGRTRRTDGWSFLHRRHLPRSQARVAGRDGDKDRSDGKRKRDGEKLREFPSRFAQIWFLNRVRHFSFILCFTISVLQIHTFVLPYSKSHSCYFKHRRLMHRTKQAYRAGLG